MAANIRIRLVNVEFLRPGPPQNQLLSPLTQYLAICGDAGAGVVNVPYEHATFERKLKELRYETGDPGDRLAMLNDMGVDMGRILGSVPGLPGGLTLDPNQPGTLIHLRLTVSASELALLPFELAKVPAAPNVIGESWLAIQTRPPVCVTRNIRTVSPEGVTWPDRPRILFVAGDPANIPFTEHREALLSAIQPFRYPGRDEATTASGGAREQYGELLTILVNPTLADVYRECRDTRYTHVHILTHGDLDETAHESYGLVLRGPDDAPDVVSGERFCSALTSVGGGVIHRPTVVSVASCDSGNVGSVVIPGASFAHALHQGGVPLVVASQFPLSTEGSVPLASALYQGLLWGEHPLLLLQQIRAELHARYTSSWHDWASLVVYEALPQTLEAQLDGVRYAQSRSAMNAALEHLDRAVGTAHDAREPLGQLERAVAQAVQRLPLDGEYGVECLGLRASARKRLAQAAYAFARLPAEGNAEWSRDTYDLLEQAWEDYELAARGMMINDRRAVQRIATLHWGMVQVESLSAVLGKPGHPGRWEAAKLCAELYLKHIDPEERAWAHGSLAELWLVRLADADLDADPPRRQEYSDRAVHHAEELARLYPSRNDFPVTSTRRQFERYVEWWGAAAFEAGLQARGQERSVHWHDDLGVIHTATRVMAALKARSGASAGPPPAASQPPSSTPPPAAGQSPGASTPGGAEPTATLAAANVKRAKKKAAPTATLARDAPFFDIEMLPAGHGDSLWIEYGDRSATHRVLVDCGTQQTAPQLLRRVEGLAAKDRHFELFVMSHIDSDHIGGALPFLMAVQKGLKFGDVWFNGWRHLSGRLGAKQGEMFSTALLEMNLPWNAWRQGAAIVVDGAQLPVQTLPGGMKLTLLSPTPAQLRKLAPAWSRELKKAGLEPGARADYSKFLKGSPSTSTDVDKLADTRFASDAAPANGSSIAVLAEYGGAAALLAADAHAPVLAEGIRTLLRERGVDRLKLDAFKVAHHASQNNLSRELLTLVDCKTYCISSNGDHFCHPDREAIARIVKYGGAAPALHFNYRTQYNELWARRDLQERHGYAAVYRDEAAASSLVSLLPRRGS